MSRIDFYQLKKQTLEDVLPKLLQKAYVAGKRVVVCTSAEKVEAINAYLWTYDDESFLPHGSKKDGFAEQQPIWITDNAENTDNACFLFLTCNVECDFAALQQYERVFDIFDGGDETSLAAARNLWKVCKEAGFEVFYWEQSSRGIWEQKA